MSNPNQPPYGPQQPQFVQPQPPFQAPMPQPTPPRRKRRWYLSSPVVGVPPSS